MKRKALHYHTIAAHVSLSPEVIPAPPTPDTARPRTSAADVGAAPAINNPISKVATKTRNTYLSEKRWYNLPNMNWNEHEVKRLWLLERRIDCIENKAYQLRRVIPTNILDDSEMRSDGRQCCCDHAEVLVISLTKERSIAIFTDKGDESNP